MKVVTYLQDSSQIDFFVQRRVEEVLIATSALSRFGELSKDNALRLVELAKKAGLRPILIWDLLMTEAQFQEAILELGDYLKVVDTVRVYDPGAFYYLLKNSSCDLQVMMEIGNHNFQGMEAWQKTGGKRLKRIIPSFELDRDCLKEYSSKLSIPLEIFALGAMPLSYTPRKLLSPLVPAAVSINGLSAIVDSLESEHRGMPVIENAHGTFTFYMKDFCILEHLEDLKEMNLKNITVDLRKFSVDERDEIFTHLFNYLENKIDWPTFKEAYPRQIFKGFFIRNKSDAVFSKLKNSQRDRTQGLILGEVIDVAKGRYMGVRLTSESGLSNGDVVSLRSPEGKIKKLEIHQIYNSQYLPINRGEKDQLIYLPHVSGISCKTLLFIESDKQEE